MTNEVTEQQAMSLLLTALGFEAMAAGVAMERDEERLQKYASVIIKNAKGELRDRAAKVLRAFGRII